MPNAAKPDREFCASCGFPLRSRRCDVCGGDVGPLPLQEGRRTEPRPAVEDNEGDLARAYEAIRNKDLGRFVGLVMSAEGGESARAVSTSDGPGWIAVVRGSLVFAAIHAVSGDLTLQAPVARIPKTQRVPVLRLALELSAQEAPTARFCLRDDLLVLRFGAQLSALTPPVLRRLLREMGALAARSADLFAVSFDARRIIPDEQRGSAGFEALGQVRKLRLGSGAIRSIPPPRASQPEVIDAVSANAPPRRGDTVNNTGVAPGVAPRTRSAGLPGPPPLPREEVDSSPKPVSSPGASLGKAGIGLNHDSVPAPRIGEQSEPIPAILAPMFASASSGSASKSKPPPVIPPLPPAPSGSGVASKSRPISMPEIDIEAPSKRPSSVMTAVTPDMLGPADRLCNLLRQGKSLAALVLEARPSSMSWLVRATVFRAIHDYRDVLPDSVAHLHRCTGLGREPGEPGLMVMERVILARGQMTGEKPLAVEPLTSATQAKEHIGRYLGEIERSPADAPLRHFLAQGALAELLVRAKLPAQTELRLRDIVTHAQREGAKQTTIDLMMTALQRIAGG